MLNEFLSLRCGLASQLTAIVMSGRLFYETCTPKLGLRDIQKVI